MKTRWIGEGDSKETGSKERSGNEERKGATKIEPKKQNENILSKGADGQQKHEMLKGKKKQEKMTNRECF